MNTVQKNGMKEKFENQMHTLGRITMGAGAVLLLLVPFIIGWIYGVMPSGSKFLSGILKVAVIYVPVAIVEVLVYSPMLGAGGTYITFLTGNVTNLKIPCVMNAKDIVGTQDGTVESEVVTTLASATSAIVTMVVLFVGVLLLIPLTPVLQNPVLTPAFDNVVPALFGALGLKYFSKSIKIAAIPLITMTLLCVLVPAAISQTSLLLIPAGAMALGIGFLLYRNGKL